MIDDSLEFQSLHASSHIRPFTSKYAQNRDQEHQLDEEKQNYCYGFGEVSSSCKNRGSLNIIDSKCGVGGVGYQKGRKLLGFCTRTKTL